MANKRNTPPQLYLARPADRSVEAYKKWIITLTQKLVPGAPNDVTEEQWAKNCQEFWEKVDEAANQQPKEERQK